jgi:hypothetical protein
MYAMTLPRIGCHTIGQARQGLADASLLGIIFNGTTTTSPKTVDQNLAYTGNAFALAAIDAVKSTPRDTEIAADKCRASTSPSLVLVHGTGRRRPDHVLTDHLRPTHGRPVLQRHPRQLHGLLRLWWRRCPPGPPRAAGGVVCEWWWWVGASGGRYQPSFSRHSICRWLQQLQPWPTAPANRTYEYWYESESAVCQCTRRTAVVQQLKELAMNSASHPASKAWLLLCGLLMFGTVHAQQPGVDCAPIQGQGWSGCAPINQPQQSSQSQQSKMPQLPPQRWLDHWGALVSDDSQGKLGVSTDKASEAEAWLSAEENCHAKGGSNCTRLISYRNECVGMALGDKTYSFSAGATASDATEKATRKCMTNTMNCHIYYSACSLPVRIQ